MPMPWRYFALLAAANLALLLPPAFPVRVAAALLLIAFLPGWGWANRLLQARPAPVRWLAASALSYVISMQAALWLHYLPGPVQTWQLLLVLNLAAVAPLLTGQNPPTTTRPVARPALRKTVPLLAILGIALALRLANLHYSEFQGDEALAMISAAEALEGHSDALWLRAKGPGEVLLPMALWRLTGTITEPVARLPFTLAAWLAVFTLYQIGRFTGERRAGWLAAGFFAFNGFMTAFGRIVQYQALVIWMSALAFLLALYWQQTGRLRFAILSGLCLGAGLLAHYDAILVIPAVGWLLAGRPFTAGSSPRHGPVALLKPGLWSLLALLLAALPFYLPYGLNPQAGRTGAYVGERIGTELRNNLPDFFHFNTFYSSSYYLVITGLLVLGVLAWWVWQAGYAGRWGSILLVAGTLAVAGNAGLLAWEKANLSALPFALLFAGAFLAVSRQPATPSRPYRQATIIWLAAPFLGYNFVVALGLTHIYTTVPAWSLLAAMGWLALAKPAGRVMPQWVPNAVLAGLAVLSTLFLWHAFIRHDVEYLQDYPAGRLSLFWTPYDRPPKAGFFGFAHRAGWKAVGQKIAAGELAGDYGSNEEPDVTAWYTRGAARACDPRPEFYFLADDLVDPVSVPQDIISTGYKQVGRVSLPNQKQMQILQQIPATLALGNLNDAALSAEFDRTATPAAFARSARGAKPVEANFGNLVRLVGYSLDTRRAYPGGRLPVTLIWQALAPVPAGYHIFVHLESPAGPVAQADGAPVCWTYPTNLWRPGQLIADHHALAIPPDTTPSAYPLEVGLYLPDSFERLDVLDEAGNPAGTGITLEVVEVGD